MFEGRQSVEEKGKGKVYKGLQKPFKFRLPNKINANIMRNLERFANNSVVDCHGLQNSLSLSYICKTF